MDVIPVAENISLTIRLLPESKRKNFIAAARRSFPNWLDRASFAIAPETTFVIERDGTLMGGIVLKLRTVGWSSSSSQRWGEVSWVFTTIDARGQGAGQALIDYACQFFKEQRVAGVYALVEGDNPSSFKLFTTRGFARAPIVDQFSHWGVHLFKIWYQSNYAMASGHFIFVSPAAEQPYSGILHILAAVCLATVCLLLNAWSWPSRLYGLGVLYAFCASLVVIGGRAAVMLGAAHVYDLPVRYYMTEPLSLLALLIGPSGGLLPIPGGVYPSASQWSMRTVQPTLGKIAFTGALYVLLCLWLPLVLHLYGLGNILRDVLHVARSLAILGAFDILAPFLKGYASSRVWAWNKGAWAVLVVILLAWVAVLIWVVHSDN